MNDDDRTFNGYNNSGPDNAGVEDVPGMALVLACEVGALSWNYLWNVAGSASDAAVVAANTVGTGIYEVAGSASEALVPQKIIDWKEDCLATLYGGVHTTRVENRDEFRKKQQKWLDFMQCDNCSNHLDPDTVGTVHKGSISYIMCKKCGNQSPRRLSAPVAVVDGSLVL